MKGSVAFSVIFCAVFLFLGSHPAAAGEAGAADLSKKADTLIRIRDDVMERLRQVQEISVLMGKKRELYEKEIRQDLGQARGMTYEAAMMNGRIANNIDLIQRIHGHAAQLFAHSAQLQELLGEVEFVLKETEDALRVQKTLSVANLPDLMKRIEMAVSIHESVAGRRLLPATQMPVMDRKKVWEMTAGKREAGPKRQMHEPPVTGKVLSPKHPGP